MRHTPLKLVQPFPDGGTQEGASSDQNRSSITNANHTSNINNNIDDNSKGAKGRSRGDRLSALFEAYNANSNNSNRKVGRVALSNTDRDQEYNQKHRRSNDWVEPRRTTGASVEVGKIHTPELPGVGREVMSGISMPATPTRTPAVTSRATPATSSTQQIKKPSRREPDYAAVKMSKEGEHTPLVQPVPPVRTADTNSTKLSVPPAASSSRGTTGNVSRQQRDWAASLADVARSVWAPLGLMHMAPYHSPEEEAGSSISGTPPLAAATTRHDVECLATLMQTYYAGYARESDDGELEEIVRHGLFMILYNAVFYCISVLEEKGGEQAAARSVPMPLLWSSAASVPEAGGDAAVGTSSSSSRSSIADMDVDLLYQGRLRTPLPIVHWYFTVRCLAQWGYSRDAFYCQGCSADASCHEVLLALLWLTKRYKLVSVSEYIVMHAKYAFLLRVHADDTSSCNTDAHSAKAGRLMAAVGQSTVWPPASFDENATIAACLAQIDAIAGPPTAADDEAGPAVLAAVPGETAPHSGAVLTRRLMALRRLLFLSLDKLQSALHQRAAQYAVLGLNSSLEAQLCLPEHHRLYELVIDGLDYACGTEGRLKCKLKSLYACGMLVSDALRRDVGAHTTSSTANECFSPSEILRGIREDNDTWLAAYAAEAESEAWSRGQMPRDSTLFDMSHALTAFRASRTRQRLQDVWRSLLRRARTTGGESLNREEDDNNNVNSFLNDAAAHAAQAQRVADSILCRYSLKGALLAERHMLRGGGGPVRREAAAEHTARKCGPSSARVAPLSLRTHHSSPSCLGSLSAPLGCAHMQPTEVGQPAGGFTTSAHMEGQRLTVLLQELSSADADGYEARVVSCQQALRDLYHRHGLRLALSVGKKKRQEEQQ